MNKESASHIKLGFFVTAGLILLVIGLYLIGNNKNLFGSTFKLVVTFQNVSGLKEGNNVRFAGIDIGTVDNIQVKNDTTISVEILIDEKMKNVIRKNSIASIGTDGLMGDKIINIDPGTNETALVKEGDEITSLKSIDTEQMLRTLEFTNKNIAVVSANLKDITEKINKSRGTLYTVLMDTTLAKGFHRTLNNIEQVSINLTSITDEFSTFVDDAKKGKGLLGTLVRDTVIPAEFQQAISRVSASSDQIYAAAKDMRESLDKINNGFGTAGTFINDTTTANHLKLSMKNIETGTQNFNEVMDALKQSFLFRGYFKRQEKKEGKNQP